MSKRKLFPVEIQSLILHSAMKTPVGWSFVEETKAKHPEYWNNIGQFDPYFKMRNRLFNYFRKMYIDYKVGKQCRREPKLWNA